MPNKFNELKKKLLLAKDKNGCIVWHHAAYFGRLEALETLWCWAKKVELTPDEMLLAKTEQGETVFHIAAQQNHIEILQKLWVWAEESRIQMN